MTRDEVLKKIEEAQRAIESYKSEGLDSAYSTTELEKIRKIRLSTESLIVEARTIGAAGRQCPSCGGSGRV